MATYTNGITIDGTFFDVPLVSIKRNAEFLDKYAERTQDGVLHRELIGVYFNYTATFGTIDNAKIYKDLYNKLTEKKEFHAVTIPSHDGNYSYSAYITGVSDEIEKILSNKTVMKSLTCKFIAERPAR